MIIDQSMDTLRTIAEVKVTDGKPQMINEPNIIALKIVERTGTIDWQARELN